MDSSLFNIYIYLYIYKHSLKDDGNFDLVAASSWGLNIVDTLLILEPDQYLWSLAVIQLYYLCLI